MCPEKISENKIKKDVKKALDYAGKNYLSVREYQEIRENVFDKELPHESTIQARLGKWKNALKKARGVYRKEAINKDRTLRKAAENYKRKTRREEKMIGCPRETCIWRIGNSSCMFPRCVVEKGWIANKD